ncbi:MAG: DUF72 domain-containing protein [Planctomycetes bacterium]|nr:DUF72 domain-containing protein [Planctomycetota bacterium]
MLLYGTSSWSERTWVGAFYPPGTKPGEMLTQYATRFSTVEADNTYYAIPSRKLVAGWEAKTPMGFVMSAKFPRSVVHAGTGEKPDATKLFDASETAKFLDVMSLLGPKCGPLVMQFPYFNQSAFRSLGEFLARLEPYLETLPKTFRYGVEVRNKAWLTPELTDSLRRHRVALVLLDLLYMPHPCDVELDLVTTDFSYVRLIGDRKATETAGGGKFDRIVVDRTERLKLWAEYLSNLGDKLPIYTYANNHYAGFGPDTARQLERLVEGLKLDR